jgi:hypothetical protein
VLNSNVWTTPSEPRHAAGTIISTIQFCESWKALITLEVDISDYEWAASCLSSTFLVFLHCKLECLDCPLELRHVGGTIISAIQFYEAWRVLIALEDDISDYEWAASCLSSTFLVFLHCKLECLDCPLEPQHAGGTIISAIQFYQAWTVLIAFEVDISDYKWAASCLRKASLGFRCFAIINSNIWTALWSCNMQGAPSSPQSNSTKHGQCSSHCKFLVQIMNELLRVWEELGHAFGVSPLWTQMPGLPFGATPCRGHHHLRSPILQRMDSAHYIASF